MLAEYQGLITGGHWQVELVVRRPAPDQVRMAGQVASGITLGRTRYQDIA